MRIEHRRLLRRGDLPGSNGGIYNPGALSVDGRLSLLCRREVDYRFSSFVFPELVELDPRTLEPIGSRTLRKVGYPEASRIEDFRCLTFNGVALVAHTLIEPGPAQRQRIKPVISRIDGETLQLFDRFELPITPTPVEKNWVLFEHDGVLHCLYGLDPLTIFAKDPAKGWVLVKEEMNGWSIQLSRTLSNSANLIPFEGGFLGFWHTLAEPHRYVQGALFLDANLTLRYRTGVLLDGRDVCDGHKPGVLYVTSLLERDDQILAFYGEADAHTGVALIDRGDLWAELQRSPFRPIEAIRIRYAGDSLSDAFRAMRALHQFSSERQHPRIRLFVGNERLRPTIRQLGTTNVFVHGAQESDYDCTLVGSGHIEWSKPGDAAMIVRRARAATESPG